MGQRNPRSPYLFKTESKMIRINQIQEALLHLVGWEQSFDPQQQIDSTLTESESGLYFQQAHPMVTLENVRAIMPDYTLYQYPEWNVATEYSKGAKVSDANKVWQSVINHNEGIKPSTADDEWEEYDFASDFIVRMTRQAIAKTVQQFLTQKSLLRESKTLLERRSLFDGAGRMNNTIQNGQRLVGMEIVPAYSMGVTTKLERIGLQMVGATGKVTLYIFHSSQRDPLYEIEFNVSKGDGSMEWKVLEDVYLPYM